MPGPKTEPWLPGRPFWETLPEQIAAGLRQDYEEKAAHFEHGGLMSQGMAEAAAYAFMFSDRPEVISPFVGQEEIDRQLLRSEIIRKTRRHFFEHRGNAFRPWVRQRIEDVRMDS